MQENQQQKVSTLELFFDLVFVFTLTQLASLLRHDPTFEGAARTVLVFSVLYWMYGGYVWLTNRVTPEPDAPAPAPHWRDGRVFHMCSGRAGGFRGQWIGLWARLPWRHHRARRPLWR